MTDFLSDLGQNGYLIFWAVLFVTFVVIELSTVQLISVWLAIGALVTCITAALEIPFWAQLVVFVTVSGVLLALTRSFVARLLAGRATPTNSELDIGKTAVVIEKVSRSAGTGRATLNGVDWKADAVSGEDIEVGETVLVKQIDGAKLIVERVPVTNERKA